MVEIFERSFKLFNESWFRKNATDAANSGDRNHVLYFRAMTMVFGIAAFYGSEHS
jgi:hypothetical protein